MRLSFVAHGEQAMGCQCGGEKQPLGQQIRQVLGGLDLAYGEQFHKEFIDLDNPDQLEHPLAIRSRNENLSFPVLFIDEEPKFTGVIPLAALKSLLDEMGYIPIVYTNESQKDQ